MSKLNIWRTSPLLHLGLTVTLGLTFLIGLLLTMSAIRPSDVAQAQVSTTTGEVDLAVPLEIQLNADTGATSTAQVPSTSVVVITPTAISHKLNGVGVHIFDSDYHSSTFTSTLQTLGLKYLRIQFGPYWDHENIPNPPVCNNETYTIDREIMYTFVVSNFNGDFPSRLTNTIRISNTAQNLGLKIILLNWRAHKTWLKDLIYRELKDDYVDDYACFVVQVARYLTDEGVKISYLEPTNEPSDISDTKIPSTTYNTFVKYTRKYLDEEGLSEVGILGPGLAYLNHDDTCRVYLDGLDDDGVAAISVWAAHAWDPVFFPNEPEEDILRRRFEEFWKWVREREPPDQPKPIFITEYACVNDPGNQICAVENTLILLDQGANAVVYWYLREQGWDLDPKNGERALLTKNYDEKPMFTALSSVLPFISGDQVWVLDTHVEDQITTASFYNADNELIVVLVNSNSESENVLIDFTEFYTVEVEIGAVYISDTNTITEDLELLPCRASGDRIRCPVSLQPNTITTLVYTGLFRVYLPVLLRNY